MIRGRRFRPTLWPTLGAVLVIAATVMLGNWQRHRATEKDALRADYERASAQAPVVLAATTPDAETLRFRAVRVTGRFDARHQHYIDNRVRNGRVGFNIVTPLVFDDARHAVLVDRGWTPLGASRGDLPAAPAPPGEVTVEGRVNLPPRVLKLGNPAASDAIWPSIDIARMREVSGLALLPVILEETKPAAPDALVRDWPPPDFGTSQHVSYMVQWYSLAALAVVLWLALNWRRTA